MIEQGQEPWVRATHRRRRRRRALLVALPVLLLAGLSALGWFRPAPDPLAVAAVVAMVALVVAGWWWLERRAGESPRRMLAARCDGSARAGDLADDLDEARADHVLRHGLPAPEGSRTRVEERARERVKAARHGLVVSPLYGALAVWHAAVADRDDHGRLTLAAGWLVLAVVLLVRSVRDRRVAGRWLAEHGTAT